jgi:MerR family transcriptional regulator/heat shock protein HspR
MTTRRWAPTRTAPALPRVDDDPSTPFVAAQLLGMHPQTLRQYDRLGLVSPDRTSGRTRLYSMRDVLRLREVQRLSNEGITLAGIQRILALEEEVERLRARLDQLTSEQRSTALVVWRPQPRRA